MSRNDPPHALTPTRLRELQLIAAGADRRRTGEPFEPNRSLLEWLEGHGYITRTKVGPNPGRRAWLASIVVTAKGWEAVRSYEQAAAV